MNSDAEIERLSSLEVKVSNLDATVVRLIAKMEAQVDDRRNYERTLRSIDENVKSLTIKMAASSGERHKETEVLLHPLWEQVRKHDGRFHECGISVKEELRKEAQSHLVLIWFGVVTICGLAAYVYNNDKTDIKNDITSVIQHIDRHHSEAKKK